MDNAMSTTLLSLKSGTPVVTRLFCRALLDTSFPQSFVHQGALDEMVVSGASKASCVRPTTQNSKRGFGSSKVLGTNRQSHMIVRFYHDDDPSFTLAGWMYTIPNDIKRCPMLLGCDSWMSFSSCSYLTLTPRPDERPLETLTFRI